MLVLSRKLGEVIVIDGGIEVTVVDIDRGKVRLGLVAPKHINIYRKELLRESDQSAPDRSTETKGGS